MSKYTYFVSRHFLTGNFEVVRERKIFKKLTTRKVVASFHHNAEGVNMAHSYCAHMNQWFKEGLWSNTTWL